MGFGKINPFHNILWGPSVQYQASPSNTFAPSFSMEEGKMACLSRIYREMCPKWMWTEKRSLRQILFEGMGAFQNKNIPDVPATEVMAKGRPDPIGLFESKVLTQPLATTSHGIISDPSDFTDNTIYGLQRMLVRSKKIEIQEKRKGSTLFSILNFLDENTLGSSIAISSSLTLFLAGIFGNLYLPTPLNILSLILLFSPIIIGVLIDPNSRPDTKTNKYLREANTILKWWEEQRNVLKNLKATYVEAIGAQPLINSARILLRFEKKASSYDYLAYAQEVLKTHIGILEGDELFNQESFEKLPPIKRYFAVLIAEESARLLLPIDKRYEDLLLQKFVEETSADDTYPL